MTLDQQFIELLSDLPKVAEQRGVEPSVIIEQWVETQDADARRAAEQLAQSWIVVHHLPEAQSAQAETEQAWLRFKDRWSTSASSLQPLRSGTFYVLLRHKYVRWGFALAASLVFVGLVYLLQHFLSSKDPQFVRIHHTALMPKEIVLSDGTKIWLKMGTVFEYPTTFSSDARRVELVKGQAYFDVHRDELRPFNVMTPRFVVYVEGTAFDIQSEMQQSVLSVQEGRVRVESRDLRFRALHLRAQQQLTLTDTTRYTRSLQDKNYLAWKTGVLSFQNTPLRQVLFVLSSYYQTSLEVVSVNSRCALTVTFNNLNLEEALALIVQLTEGTQVSLPEGGYRLTPKRCI